MVIGELGTVSKGLLMGLETLEVGDHSNYSTEEISYNTKISTEYLSRFSIVQTSIKYHQLNQVGKTRSIDDFSQWQVKQTVRTNPMKHQNDPDQSTGKISKNT